MISRNRALDTWPRTSAASSLNIFSDDAGEARNLHRLEKPHLNVPGQLGNNLRGQGIRQRAQDVPHSRQRKLPHFFGDIARMPVPNVRETLELFRAFPPADGTHLPCLQNRRVSSSDNGIRADRVCSTGGSATRYEPVPGNPCTGEISPPLGSRRFPSLSDYFFKKTDVSRTISAISTSPSPSESRNCDRIGFVGAPVLAPAVLPTPAVGAAGAAGRPD